MRQQQKIYTVLKVEGATNKRIASLQAIQFIWLIAVAIVVSIPVELFSQAMLLGWSQSTQWLAILSGSSFSLTLLFLIILVKNLWTVKKKKINRFRHV
ncbi:MAG: hypothetical protein KBT36_02190 [Kurthia sp.]|nr:hypothetical protein [Candidatus Kurthia equi]